MNNLLNDLQKGYIRMFIVICIWILIPTPILFIVPNESVFFALITWMTWVILGILLSPKIVKKIWE